MSNTFSLDGVEYALDAIPPEAAMIVDGLAEITRRAEPIQRELLILNVARDSLVQNLRSVLKAHETQQESLDV